MGTASPKKRTHAAWCGTIVTWLDHVLLTTFTCLALSPGTDAAPAEAWRPCSCNTGALDSPSNPAHGLSSARPCSRAC